MVCRWVGRVLRPPAHSVPLWAQALVIATVLAFAVLAAARMAAGLEPSRTGTHRKPAPGRRRTALEETS
jgi:hypothetical protein